MLLLWHVFELNKHLFFYFLKFNSVQSSNFHVILCPLRLPFFLSFVPFIFLCDQRVGFFTSSSFSHCISIFDCNFYYCCYFNGAINREKRPFHVYYCLFSLSTTHSAVVCAYIALNSRVCCVCTSLERHKKKYYYRNGVEIICELQEGQTK